MKRRLLSKSKYLNGLQCHKYIWLLFNDPRKVSQPDSSTQYLFDEGHRVGELAKRLFPKGIDIPSDDFISNLNQTKELLREKRPLFEPGFYVDGYFSRLDILYPVGNSIWDIYEVKASTSVKDVNIQDVSFQRYCAQKAGLTIRKCFLIHINNQYVKSGAIDPEGFFTLEDITEDVSAVAGGVADKSEEMWEVIASSTCPDIGVGPQCNDPYPCPVRWCWDSLPDNDIFELYRGGKKCFDMFEKGVRFIKEIPTTIKLSATQQIQQSCGISGEPYLDTAALRKFIDSLKYPLYYLDFETFSPIIPIYEGTRPYQRIPFQFSLHIVEYEGTEHIHRGFLADGTGDPRPMLLKMLRESLGEKGNIIVYNQSFEKGVLKELGEVYPEHSAWIADICNRVVDLYTPFRNFNYYHPTQKGNTSIKKVLPALTGKGYSGLEIANGDEVRWTPSLGQDKGYVKIGSRYPQGVRC